MQKFEEFLRSLSPFKLGRVCEQENVYLSDDASADDHVKGVLDKYIELRETEDALRPIRSELCALQDEDLGHIRSIGDDLCDMVDRFEVDSKLDQLKDDIREAQKKYLSKECNVMVLGDTSSGKSTLLNILLGFDLLKTHHAKCTAHIWHVSYGCEWRLSVLKLSETESSSTGAAVLSKCGESEVKEYIQSNELVGDVGSLRVVVELELPHELLRCGIQIVDSPGLNDVGERDKLVARYANTVAAIIVLVHGEQGFTDSLGEVVSSLKQKDPLLPMFTVHTHMDNTSSEDQATAISQLSESMQRQLVLEPLGPNNYTSGNLKAILESLKTQRYPGLVPREHTTLMLQLHEFMLRAKRAKIHVPFAYLKQAATTIRANMRRVVLMCRKTKTDAEKDKKRCLRRIAQFEEEREKIVTSLKSSLDDHLERLKSRLVLEMTTEDSYLQRKIHELIARRVDDHVKTKSLPEMDKFVDGYQKFVEGQLPRFFTDVAATDLHVMFQAMEQKLADDLQRLEFLIHGAVDALTSDVDIEDPLPLRRSLTHFFGKKMREAFPSVSGFGGLGMGGAAALGLFSAASLWISVPITAVVAVGGCFMGVVAAERMVRFQATSIMTDLRYREEAVRHVAGDYCRILKEKSGAVADAYLTSMRDHVTVKLEQHLDHMGRLLTIVKELDTLTETLRKNPERITQLEEAIQTFERTALIFRRPWLQFEDLFVSPCRVTMSRQMLGSGAFSEVYVATMRGEMGQLEVGAKVVHCSRRSSHRLVMNEIEALRAVRSEYVVRCHGVTYDDQGRPVLLQQKCDCALKEYLPEHKSGWTVRKAVNLVGDVARGIQAIHVAGYIHRDLCPANVFMLDGRAIVGDLGQCVAEQDASYTKSGKSCFRAPEAGDEGADSKQTTSMDVYSLGVMLFHVLHPAYMYDSQEPHQIIRAIGQHTPRRIKALIVECMGEADKRPTIDEFLSRMYSYDVLPHAPPVKLVPGFRERPLRVLCLDGGGSRGLIQAKVLEQLEARSGKKVCEMFDFVVGTSTGGILALAMSVGRKDGPTLLNSYRKLAAKVFDKRFVGVNLIRGRPMYSAAKLHDELQTMVGQLPLRPENTHVPVFVTSRRGTRPGPFLLRSYDPSVDARDRVCRGVGGWNACDAARATSAAPFYFEPFLKEGIAHTDGGAGYNNPTGLALDELIALSCNIGVVVSIGTGRPQEIAADGAPSGWVAGHAAWSLKQLFEDELTDTETTHRSARLRCECMEVPYFRVNPSFPSTIPLALDTTDPHLLDSLARGTVQYLEGDGREEFESMLKCVK